VPDLVFPGHPRADHIPQSPNLTQSRWESLLDYGIRDMQLLLARYEADGADFLDGHPKRLLPELFYFGVFRGFSVCGFFAGGSFFLVDAPGGPGLADFLVRSLRELGVDPRPPSGVLLTSCDPQATAGLTELIERYHVPVIAPPEGIPMLERAHPGGIVFRSALDPQSYGGLSVVAIPLEGRGQFPIAYRVEQAGKSVLFSGMIPSKLSQLVGDRLIRDLISPPGNSPGYLTSLNRLGPVRPDLWLPLVPTDDQNANLYDDDWSRALEENINLVRYLDSRRRAN
jgi:glyoxylase-like metal-dependent hydrolase (beta-lactamase superfamily II)